MLTNPRDAFSGQSVMKGNGMHGFNRYSMYAIHTWTTKYKQTFIKHSTSKMLQQP